MEFRQFVSELKDRKVYRTAAVYCAGAWALLQVADIIFPVVGLPEWTVTAVLVISALGFPLALILSWLFELTPEGKVTTDPASRDAAAPSQFSSVHVIELTLILILCGLVGYLYMGRLAVPQAAPAVSASPSLEQPLAEASIAVMPFVNLSEEADLEYLGDGLAEEILNLLARLNELNVAARTSSFYFKDKDVDIQTVGRQLGVEHVLEGSVRPAGDRVRVTAQLIKTEDGFHVWSETYDRPLEDALVFQDEIAAEVVKQLELLVSDESRTVLGRGQRLDGKGYDFYLRGRAYLRNPGDSQNLEFAIRMFDKAIAANPKFAEPFAGKCEALLGLYAESRAPAQFENAEDACQRALTLDRRSPGVYVALGQLYLASGQQTQAIEEFDTALALKPSYVEALLGKGEAYLDQSEVELSQEALEAALDLNPDHWRAQNQMGNFLFSTGRIKEARPYYQRLADLMPDNAGVLSNLGATYFMEGDYQQAIDAWEVAIALNPAGLMYANLATSYYFMGRYEEAIPLYKKAVDMSPEDYELWGNLGDVYRYSEQDREMSEPMYEKAIMLAQKWLDVNASDSHAHGMVAHYLAAVGRREEALEHLTLARNLSPGDMYVNYSAATALTTLGEQQAAMTALENALDAGFPMHMALADANLTGIKGLPRFEEATARWE